MTLIEILKELENIFECPVSKLVRVKAKHSKNHNGLILKDNLVIITQPNGNITIFNRNGYLYSDGEFAASIISEEMKELKAKLAKVERELDNMPMASALTLGRGTQRLGHAMKKREGLAQRKFNLIQQIEEIENKL